MEKEYGNKKATALAKYHGVVSLTKDDAERVITTLWPNAGKASPEEVFKAVTICTQYGLNPLMRHLFLVPYWNKERERYDYVCILGITSNRLIASRKHQWSFLDDTPRVSTEEEETKHYRKANPDKIRAIAKIRDVESGAEVTAWGEWNVWKLDKQGKKVRNEPKGVDKGNSMENMACIRAERKGLDMLYPADMPSSDIPVMDDQFFEGEATVLDEPEPAVVLEIDEPAESELFPPADQGGGAGEDISKTTKGEGSKKSRTSAARRTSDLITPDDVPDGYALEKIAYEVWRLQPAALWPDLNYKSVKNFEEAEVESAWDCFLKLKSVRG